MCGDCANVMTIFMVYVSLFSAVMIDDANIIEMIETMTMPATLVSLRSSTFMFFDGIA